MNAMSRGSERSKMNNYQISPKNIHWFLRYYTFFAYFLGPPLFLRHLYLHVLTLV